jgi:hypothetical protein
MLYGRFRGKWETIYQQYYDDYSKKRYGGMVKVSNQINLEKLVKAGKWSDEYLFIENESHQIIRSRSIFIPIHIQYVFENDKNSLCLLAFLKPTRDIYEDFEVKKAVQAGYNYSCDYITNLATMWFSWKNYQNLLCNSFSAQVYEKDYGKVINANELDNERNRILSKLFWPTPLKNYMYIIESGWDRLTDSELEPKNWSSAMRERLCLGRDSDHCKVDDSHVQYCKLTEQKDSEVFEKLINLIPYLKIKEWDWYPDFCNTGFDELSKLTPSFFSGINFDSIEKRSLLCFFSYNFWKHYINKDNRYTSMLGPSELGKCLLNSINISFQLLADTGTKENYIDSLIWAVSRYGHEVLGIEPRLDIGSHLLYLARGESALYTLKAYYRDHFFHSVEVCFLGHLILDIMIKSEGKCLWKYVAEYMHVDSREDVLREWYVAALFHDIGYAIEIFNGVTEAMKFFKNSDGLSIFNNKLTEALSALSTKLNGSFDFTDKDKPEGDHGIIGAVHVKSLIDKISESKPELHDYSFACSAIANHNHRKNKITFSENPIAFLLILCDTLQEWNRLNFTHSTAPSVMLQRLSSYKSSEGEYYLGPLERVYVNLEKGNMEDDYIAQLDPSTLKFTLVYSNDINKDSGVFNLWLDSVCNLQRLDMDGLPFEDIGIQLITPLYAHGGKKENQMHRLREAYLETHMNFMHDFFPHRIIENGITNGGVTYYEKAENMPKSNNDRINLSDKEAFVISLRKLMLKKIISGTMSDFRDKLKRWRRYNEDREFKGDYDSEIPG